MVRFGGLDMSTELATPLRAEPIPELSEPYWRDKVKLKDASGRVLGILDKNDAAALVAMSEDAKRLEADLAHWQEGLTSMGLENDRLKSKLEQLKQEKQSLFEMYDAARAETYEAVECGNRFRDALRQVKLHCLTTKQSGPLALAHIVRICIGAGIKEKLNADNTDLDKAALAAGGEI